MAPDLWSALQDELLPVARDDDRVAHRAQVLLDRRDALWDDYRARDPRGAVALGKSWQAATDDIVGALLTAELPAISDRAELEGLLALVQERMGDSFTAVSLILALRGAIG